MEFKDLIDRIRNNLDPCEVVEYLEIDIDDLLRHLGGYVYERREKFDFLDDDKYEELR